MKELRDHILNDDCLEHIFTYLPIKDLFSAGQTCQQFQRVAQSIVHTRHLFIQTKDISNDLSYEKFQKFLEIFASEIKGISVNALALEARVRESKFLKLLLEHFSNECRLETLELINFYSFSIPTINLFNPIFSKLKTLTLQHLALPLTIPYIIKKWAQSPGIIHKLLP